jgi:hypothetical protein
MACWFDILREWASEKRLLTIKKWLKVGKRNALSGDTASGRSVSSMRGYSLSLSLLYFFLSLSLLCLSLSLSLSLFSLSLSLSRPVDLIPWEATKSKFNRRRFWDEEADVCSDFSLSLSLWYQSWGNRGLGAGRAFGWDRARESDREQGRQERGEPGQGRARARKRETVFREREYWPE